MFGYQDDKLVIYIFVLLQNVIHICKFQNKSPTYQAFKAYLKIK